MICVNHAHKNTLPFARPISLRADDGINRDWAREGKLELTKALRSYAGGAANWAPHRAERGPYTGRGASTVGLFAVTGPAPLLR